jgi:hypothetical protein
VHKQVHHQKFHINQALATQFKERKKKHRAHWHNQGKT